MADKRQKRGAWDENKALVTSARQKFITLTCTQLLSFKERYADVTWEPYTDFIPVMWIDRIV